MNLGSSDRKFFSLVSRAIFANPFSDERIALDLEIAEIQSPVGRFERVDRVIETVNQRIQSLEDRRDFKFIDLPDDDRLLMEQAYLFQFFHRYIKEFDRLILDQIKAGERPIKVRFAPEGLATLTHKGFTAEAANRYFALSYQLRRAFFFIDHSLVGRSVCMKELRRNLWDNVFTCDIGLYYKYLWNRMEDFSTLILGETGSGKGTAAGAIGRSGYIPFDPQQQTFTESFARSFTQLNLSQFPESLIESELFGHKKGSFTGAVDDYRGILDHCSPHGAIFLDEIGEISIPVQIKLLQVLQERTFSPVGSHDTRRFQGRVIAATNRPLGRMRSSGTFRDDFFYRLCSDIITVPPLSQRIAQDRAELEDLTDHTVARMVGQSSPELNSLVLESIDRNLGAHYPWPGNVRELEQCIRRILIKKNYAGDPVAPPDNFQDEFNAGTLDARTLMAGYCFRLFKKLGTYENVARQTGLDRRTVKKHIETWIADHQNM